MPIPRRDSFEFRFDGGKGIRTDQLFGAFIKSVTKISGGHRFDLQTAGGFDTNLTVPDGLTQAEIDALLTIAVQGLAGTAYVDSQDAKKASLAGATFTGAVKGIAAVADEDFVRQKELVVAVAAAAASGTLAEDSITPAQLKADSNEQKTAFLTRLDALQRDLKNIDALTVAEQKAAISALGLLLEGGKPSPNAQYAGRIWVDPHNDEMFICRNRPYSSAVATGLFRNISAASQVLSGKYRNGEQLSDIALPTGNQQYAFVYGTEKFYESRQVPGSTIAWQWHEVAPSVVLAQFSTANWTTVYISKQSWDEEAMVRVPQDALPATTDYYYWNFRTLALKSLRRDTYVAANELHDHWQWEPLSAKPAGINIVDARDGNLPTLAQDGSDDQTIGVAKNGLYIVRLVPEAGAPASVGSWATFGVSITGPPRSQYVGVGIADPTGGRPDNAGDFYYNSISRVFRLLSLRPNDNTAVYWDDMITRDLGYPVRFVGHYSSQADAVAHATQYGVATGETFNAFTGTKVETASGFVAAASAHFSRHWTFMPIGTGSGTGSGTDTNDYVTALAFALQSGAVTATATFHEGGTVVATGTDLIAPLKSPALTGVPTAPAVTANSPKTQIATKGYVNDEFPSDLFQALAGGIDGLPSKYEEVWLRHVSWWAGEDASIRLVSVAIDSSTKKLWAATRRHTGNITLLTGSEADRTLKMAAFDPDDLLIQGDTVITLKDRMLKSWKGADSQVISFGANVANITPNLPVTDPSDKWVGIDVFDNKFFALRRNALSDKLFLIRSDFAQVPAYSGANKLINSEITAGPVARDVWSSAAPLSGRATGDLRVVAETGKILDLDSFNILNGFRYPTEGEQVVNMLINTGTQDVFDANESNPERGGSFTGNKYIFPGLFIRRVRIRTVDDARSNFILNVDNSVVPVPTLAAWLADTTATGGSDKSLYVILEDGTHTELVFADRTGVGGAFVAWHAAASQIKTQLEDQTIQVFIAKAGGLTLGTRLTLGRNPTASNQTFSAWNFGTHRASHSFYYVAADKSITEHPFASASISPNELSFDVADAAAPARPAANAAVRIVIAAKGGIAPAHEAELNDATLVRVPTTDLPAGVAIAMSAKDNVLSALFSNGNIVKWKIGGSQITRIPADDFEINQVASLDTPVSIIDGMAVENYFIHHASEYVRLFNTSVFDAETAHLVDRISRVEELFNNIGEEGIFNPVLNAESFQSANILILSRKLNINDQYKLMSFDFVWEEVSSLPGINGAPAASTGVFRRFSTVIPASAFIDLVPALPGNLPTNAAAGSLDFFVRLPDHVNAKLNNTDVMKITCRHDHSTADE